MARVSGPLVTTASPRRARVAAASAVVVLALLARRDASASAVAHAGLRVPDAVAALASAPAAPRNVLLVLGESLRFDDGCGDPAAPCRAAPFTDRAAPERVRLTQMRATASTTAISLSVILSGLPPTRTGDAIRHAPTLFDYAHAAGWDAAYWSSQPLMFTRSAEFFAALPLARRCEGKDLGGPVDDDAGASDAALALRVRRELPSLHEPWLALVQVTNTHFPYLTGKGSHPFQPESESKAAEDAPAFRNHYRNAVHAQDRALGELLAWLRTTPAGRRTVVVFTADHGEAFREHGQLGHTTSLYDEELHVPAWIDAPAGTLAPAEAEALRAARGALTSHVDLAPTVLDLLGVLDAPALSTARARMLGESLLRPRHAAPLVPLTNCAGIWSCGFENWGAMRGSLKLVARDGDADWKCFDVARDPGEQRDLGAPACGDLPRAARALFGRLPSEEPAAKTP